MICLKKRHNPYFNRWFSAIELGANKERFVKRHNPYFNRWFSAISECDCNQEKELSHNPYFNRWFSAIRKSKFIYPISFKSQSLF